MDGQHRPPPVVECPGCRGVAALDHLALLHWCPRCERYTEQLAVELALQPHGHRPAAYNLKESTQRRWYRWLTTWGPRLVTALTGRTRP